MIPEWDWSRSNKRAIVVVAASMSGCPDSALRANHGFVPNVNRRIGTNLAKTNEKRYKGVCRSLVGREGLGPSTLRLIGGSSTRLNYRPTWWVTVRFSPDHSHFQGERSRSHELRPPRLKGGWIRVQLPSISCFSHLRKSYNPSGVCTNTLPAFTYRLIAAAIKRLSIFFPRFANRSERSAAPSGFPTSFKQSTISAGMLPALGPLSFRLRLRRLPPFASASASRSFWRNSSSSRSRIAMASRMTCTNISLILGFYKRSNRNASVKCNGTMKRNVAKLQHRLFRNRVMVAPPIAPTLSGLVSG